MTRWQWAGLVIGAVVAVPLALLLFDLPWLAVLLLVAAAAGVVVLTAWADRRTRCRGRGL